MKFYTDIINFYMGLLEGLAIRVLWLIHATRLRRTPGLCPPACSEGHTYKWPCRARIKSFPAIKRDRYSHYDTNRWS